MEYKIYTLNHPITNEVRYIGYTRQSLEKRLYEHWRKRDKESLGSHKTNWFRKLNNEGLKPNIFLLETCSSLSEALKREVELISEYRKNGYRLTNATDGGEALVGYKITEEVRQKLRMAKLGKKRGPHSEETKRKISESNKGRKMTEEQVLKMKMHVKTDSHREKLRMVNVGKKLSEETVSKMSECRKKEWAEGIRKATVKGLKKTEEQKNKVRGKGNPFYGKKHTKETRLKISIAVKESNKNKKSKSEY